MFKLLPLVAALAACSAINAGVKVEKLNYKGWPNSYRVSNGQIELVVTGDVGPRIMRLGFPGGQNLLKEFPEELGKSGEKEHHLRGGHRLWKAPEDTTATWAPDNDPVKIEITENGVIATGLVEPWTGLQKQIVVEMAASGTSVTLTHRITNKTLFAVEFAPWAVSMMAPGGVAIAGFPPRGPHPGKLDPTNPLTMWNYTDLTDKRWGFARNYLMLRQDPHNTKAQKIGLFNEHTWAAYLLNGELFLKQVHADPTRTYTDFGCSLETFTNDEFLELETLGPLTKVGPDQSVVHVERWSLHKDPGIHEFTDSELDRLLQPLLQ